MGEWRLVEGRPVLSQSVSGAGEMWILLAALPALLAGVTGTEQVERARWMPKCCPDGEAVVAGLRGCQTAPVSFSPNFSTPEGFELPDLHYRVRYGRPHCNFTKMRPWMYSSDVFYILEDGYLYRPEYDKLIRRVLPTDYCLENFVNGTEVQMMAAVCITLTADHVLIITPTGCIISFVCLMVIGLIYIFNKRYRNVHGKIVKFYSLTMAASYLLTGVVHLWGSYLNDALCDIFGYFINFCCISSSMWLTFMCYNTMKEIKEHRVGQRQEGNRIALYILMGVCGPLLALVVIFSLLPMAHFNLPSAYLNQHLYYLDACWFLSHAAPFTPLFGLALVFLVADVSFIVCSFLQLKDASLTKSITPLMTNWSNPQYRKILQLRQCLLVWALSLACLAVDVVSLSLGTRDCMLVQGLSSLQGAVLLLPLVVLDPQLRAELRHRPRVRYHPQPLPLPQPQAYPNYVFCREPNKPEGDAKDSPFRRMWSVA